MSNPTQTVVLVADDEPSTRALVSNHLRTKGYSVLEAADGDDAWLLAQEHLPDLIVLDVMMPGMSGWEVCRRIRETVSLAHTGVVMLTGIGENLNEMTSPLYGADAYVDKPFEFANLDAQLIATLDRRRGGTLGRPDGADVNDGSDEDPATFEFSEPPPIAVRRDTVPSAGEEDPVEDRVPASAPRRLARPAAPTTGGSAKKAPAKKAPAKKAPAKKAPAKKAPAKKAPAKKAPAKKAPAKKAPARRTASGRRQ